MEGVGRSQTGVNPLITTSAHRGYDEIIMENAC